MSAEQRGDELQSNRKLEENKGVWKEAKTRQCDVGGRNSLFKDDAGAQLSQAGVCQSNSGYHHPIREGELVPRATHPTLNLNGDGGDSWLVGS